MINSDRDLSIPATRSSIVVELMLAQYRMARVEEVVTKNVFRIIWFGFCIYVASAPLSFESVASSRIGALTLLAPMSYVLIAAVLMLLSNRNSQRLSRQSSIIRSMIVSLDSELKDYYVHELERDKFRSDRTSSTFANFFLKGEDAWWFAVVLLVLYLQIALKLIPILPN